jgi:hypothetical protein
MSTNISNKSELRNKEKEELIQRLLQIQKEEEEKEEQVENTVTEAYPIQNDFFIRQFNNDDNIIIDNKVKRKRLKIDNNDTELISEYTSMDSSPSSSSSSLVIELETRRKYYPQNVYQTNFNKYPLLLVTYQNYVRDNKPFILNQLKNLQN